MTGKDTRALHKRFPEIVIALLAVVLIAAGTVRAVQAHDDDRAEPGQAPVVTVPPPTPSQTAPAATPVATPTPAPRPTTATQVYASLVAFTAHERGLAFRRPVRPQYVSGKAFDAALLRIGRTSTPAQRTRKTPAYNARVSTFLALKVLRSRFEADDYYAHAGRYDRPVTALDPRTGRLLVRGGSLTPYVQQEIVRELTLVLDAQRFPHKRITNPEAQRAFSALAQGDADRVARAWYSAAPATTRRAVDRATVRLFGDGGGSPDALSIYDSYPDLAGPQLVTELLALGGQERLDAAFRRPPVTTAQVRDPRLATPKVVSVPALPQGARRVEVGELGELGLAIVLQEYPTSPSAAKGWRGDRYLTYAVGRTTCTLLQVRTSSRAQQAALVKAAKRVLPAVIPLGSTAVAIRGCTTA